MNIVPQFNFSTFAPNSAIAICLRVTHEKDGIILGMRSGLQFVALIGFLSLYACASARPLEVAQLPVGEFADTEVSTNIAFAVDCETVTRIDFAIALDATPTNDVEVAIGADGDGDGSLSVEEAAYVFGYDCGEWFCRDTDGNMVERLAVNYGQLQQTRLSHGFGLKRRQLDAAWNLVKVTRRGRGTACELVKVKGYRPGFMLEVR